MKVLLIPDWQGCTIITDNGYCTIQGLPNDIVDKVIVSEIPISNGIGLIEKKRLGLGRPNVIYVKNFLLQDMKKTTEKENSISEQRGMYHNSRMVKITILE